MFTIYSSKNEFLKVHQQQSYLAKKTVQQQVENILSEVKNRGGEAIKYFTKKFDAVELDTIRVPEEKIEQALAALPSNFKRVLNQVAANIKAFHEHQVPTSWQRKEKNDAILGMQYRPIKKVGCYIPGGTAGYPSTVLMTVIPAQIAGVSDIALASPPDKNGKVNPLVLGTAGLLGIKTVYSIGGAQAVAAFAFGTESVTKVDKIVGPGNAYVNEAKRQVFGIVGIDSLAGPTELVIFADETAAAEWIVRDLFAQAEHDISTRVILLSTSKKLLAECQKVVESTIGTIKRQNVVQTSIKNNGAFVLVESTADGSALINEIAPEHVQIMTEKPEDLLPEIKNAGAICLGKYTPAVVGDYFAGPNHVLPTAQTARFSSPLNVLDFMKFSSIMQFSKHGCEEAAQDVADFAELERLYNHREALLCRKKESK